MMDGLGLAESTPGPLIIVEGILVLSDPALQGCFDLTVYVDCPDDIRLIRRLRRDISERGRTMDSVLDQYLATVRGVVSPETGKAVWTSQPPPSEGSRMTVA